jgi:hypothetical protein
MAQSKLNSTNVSQEQYNEFKEKALNHSIVRRVISFKDLTLISDSIIEYSGVQFQMTENAFKSLVKILGLSNGVMETITKQLGESVTNKLLSMMKVAMSSDTSKNTICILVDKKTSKIVGFSKSAQSILSNNAYFTLFEQTMNNHTGMHIKNMGITENGNIEISVLNDNWEFNVGGLSDEYFKSGLVFINTPDSTIINPFNERLVCTNGMVVSDNGLSLILKNGDANSISGFFDAVRNLSGTINFEKEFKNRIIKMMDTKASYGEVLSVRKNVEYHVSNISHPDVRASVEQFIPTQYIHRSFLDQKVDIYKIDSKNYAKINTMLTVWDLVNRLTDLSSHPVKYGFELQHGNSSIFELQKAAGNLSFKKQYDLECAVKQIF